VLASELKPHPRNARIHPAVQKLAVKESLETIGWVQDILVNRRTGFMLNGHLRLELALETGEKVPVTYVDLDPQEELLVLAALDPVSNMAIADEDELAKLMADLDFSEDSTLQTLLSGMLTESIAEEPKLVGDKPLPKATGAPARPLGEKQAQIRVVLYAGGLATFERALKATGEINRGKALIKLCNFWLEAHDDDAAV
jgi:ParB-like chromosome segregation protein Spo0J